MSTHISRSLSQTGPRFSLSACTWCRGKYGLMSLMACWAGTGWWWLNPLLQKRLEGSWVMPRTFSTRIKAHRLSFSSVMRWVGEWVGGTVANQELYLNLLNWHCWVKKKSRNSPVYDAKGGWFIVVHLQNTSIPHNSIWWHFFHS
jgi:hypothetical protein